MFQNRSRVFLHISSVQIFWVLVAFFMGSLTTYFLASIFQSIFVLSALEGAGAKIPVDLWLHTLCHDLYGHTFSGYVPFGLAIIIAFLVAMPTAALVHKFLKIPKGMVYPLAGAVAMATMLYIAKSQFLDVLLWAGTRSAAGFSSQLLAGAVGGIVFAILSNCDGGFVKEY